MAEEVDRTIKEVERLLADLSASKTGSKDAKRNAILPVLDYLIAKHDEERQRLAERASGQGLPLTQSERDRLDKHNNDIRKRKFFNQGQVLSDSYDTIRSSLEERLGEEIKSLKKTQQQIQPGGRRRKTRRRGKKSRKSRR